MADPANSPSNVLPTDRSPKGDAFLQAAFVRDDCVKMTRTVLSTTRLSGGMVSELYMRHLSFGEKSVKILMKQERALHLAERPMLTPMNIEEFYV